MGRFSQEQIEDRLNQAGLVATLVIDEVEAAIPLADALLAGGLDVMELTLRTRIALEALAEVRRKRPEILCGAGTVLTIQNVQDLALAGIDFAVAPGLNPLIVKEAQTCGIPFSPGVMTPSDIDKAVELNCRLLKFFPAEPAGGVGFLKSMAAPYRHLGLKFVPLGGLNEQNIKDYLAEETVLAVGGSWMAPRKLIQAGNWDEITRLVYRAREIVMAVRI